MKKLFFLFLVLSLLSQFAFSGQDQETFLILKNNVNCPFAKSAKIWRNNSYWDISLSIEENVNIFLDNDLKPFINNLRNNRAQHIRPLDGIALEAPAEHYGNNLEGFSKFFYLVLTKINKKSVDDLRDLKQDENGIFLDNGWQFSYEGERFFIITIAPYYGIDSSRYNYGGKNYIILFQPENSFKSVLSKNQEIRLNQKQKVREIFSKSGQPYEGKIVPKLELGIKAHEAPRYIKPLHLNLPPVEWWKLDSIQSDETENLSSEDGYSSSDYETELGGPIRCTIM